MPQDLFHPPSRTDRLLDRFASVAAPVIALALLAASPFSGRALRTLQFWDTECDPLRNQPPQTPG